MTQTPNLTDEELQEFMEWGKKRQEDLDNRFSSWKEYFDALKIKSLNELQQYKGTKEYQKLQDDTITQIINYLHWMVREEPLTFPTADGIGGLVDRIVALSTFSYVKGSDHTHSDIMEAFQEDAKRMKEAGIVVKPVLEKSIEESLKRYEDEMKKLSSEIRPYLPNKKYPTEMLVFFQNEWVRLKSQTEAYDSTAKRFNLDPDKADSFIRIFRNRREEVTGSKLPI